MSGLVVHTPNWLGDSIMCRPAVASLLCGHGKSPAVVVAHPRVAALWRAWPGLHVVETRPGPWLADAIGTAGQLRRIGRFEHGYLFSASFRSAATLVLAGVAHRIGFAAGGRSFLLTDPVPRLPAGRLHYSREFRNLLPPGAPAVAVPGLSWPEAAADRARQLLDKAGLINTGYAVIAPGSAGPAKRYPAAAWREVIRSLSAQIAVVLVGTSTDVEVAAEVAREISPPPFNLCGATDLAELAWVLAHAAGFVGADSGAAHLAAEMGCPAVVLFGPGDPRETAPSGEQVRLLRDGLWCSPCRSRLCLRPEFPSECMDRIPPEQVVASLVGVLRSAPRWEAPATKF